MYTYIHTHMIYIRIYTHREIVTSGHGLHSVCVCGVVCVCVCTYVIHTIYTQIVTSGHGLRGLPPSDVDDVLVSR
jgi:hypothetical protein